MFDFTDKLILRFEDNLTSLEWMPTENNFGSFQFVCLLSQAQVDLIDKEKIEQEMNTHFSILKVDYEIKWDRYKLACVFSNGTSDDFLKLFGLLNSEGDYSKILTTDCLYKKSYYNSSYYDYPTRQTYKQSGYVRPKADFLYPIEDLN